MVNLIEDIAKILEHFEAISPYSFEPFWDMPDFGHDPFWGPAASDGGAEDLTLFISGPSRNGNHMIHSMLDSHPELPQTPGEDSFLAAFFEDARKDPEEAKMNLKGKHNIDYILTLNGYGCNKWGELHKLRSEKARKRSQSWSGTQEGQAFVLDYEDTVVNINYKDYHNRLKDMAEAIRGVSTFMDILWLYLDALGRLAQSMGSGRYRYCLVGSGMRAETFFVLERSKRFRCLVPIRPFDSYYFSFAKGRLRSDAIRSELVKEAWEHWWHKVVDYLILKRRYPEAVCLVNYESVVSETEAAASEICRFLGIRYDDTCLTPTLFGVPTKGNSSFPKSESHRGRFYADGTRKRLPREWWPDLYPPIWDMVRALAI